MIQKDFEETSPNPSKGGENSGSAPGYITADSRTYHSIKDERTRLKIEMTSAEKLLCDQFKNKKLGYKFRRQHVSNDEVWTSPFNVAEKVQAHLNSKLSLIPPPLEGLGEVSERCEILSTDKVREKTFV